MQIYVEIERARLTKTLANIKEQSGEIKEAASILQELQVSRSAFSHGAKSRRYYSAFFNQYLVISIHFYVSFLFKPP